MLLIKEKMAELLRRENISVRKLSAQLGVSMSMVRKYITGQSPLPPKRAERLMALFTAEKLKDAIDWEKMHVRCPI